MRGKFSKKTGKKSRRREITSKLKNKKSQSIWMQMRRGRGKSQSRMRFREMLPQHLFPFPAFFFREKSFARFPTAYLSSSYSGGKKKHKSVSLLANGKTRAGSENEWNFLGKKSCSAWRGWRRKRRRGKGSKRPRLGSSSSFPLFRGRRRRRKKKRRSGGWAPLIGTRGGRLRNPFPFGSRGFVV